MFNSRDIDKLRPDVAVNCKVFLDLCKQAGFPVLVTGTVRDNEFQMQCYKNGTSKLKTPTFHSIKAGLAFDICKNVRGQEYNDVAFWRGVSAIGKKIGFTWGGDWKGFPDKPHFQWDAHGRYNGTHIRAGNYPPQMPKFYEEEQDMTAQEVQTIVAKALADRDSVIHESNAKVAKQAEKAWEKYTKLGIYDGTRPGAPLTREEDAIIRLRSELPVWDKLEDVPDWGKATAEKLVQRGVLGGTDTGLGLTNETLRVLVINDRAGVYGK